MKHDIDELKLPHLEGVVSGKPFTEPAEDIPDWTPAWQIILLIVLVHLVAIRLFMLDTRVGFIFYIQAVVIGIWRISR